MCLCGDVLYIQIKKWYVKFGATGSLNKDLMFSDLALVNPNAKLFMQQGQLLQNAYL